MRRHDDLPRLVFGGLNKYSVCFKEGKRPSTKFCKDERFSRVSASLWTGGLGLYRFPWHMDQWHNRWCCIERMSEQIFNHRWMEKPIPKCFRTPSREILVRPQFNYVSNRSRSIEEKEGKRKRFFRLGQCRVGKNLANRLSSTLGMQIQKILLLSQ